VREKGVIWTPGHKESRIGPGLKKKIAYRTLKPELFACFERWAVPKKEAKQRGHPCCRPRCQGTQRAKTGGQKAASFVRAGEEKKKVRPKPPNIKICDRAYGSTNLSALKYKSRMVPWGTACNGEASLVIDPSSHKQRPELEHTKHLFAPCAVQRE